MKEVYQHEYFKGYVRPDRPITTLIGLRKIIERVAKAKGFTLSPNAEKIINAKLMMCKEDLKKCPCDHASTSKRYCGSPTCVRETKEKGHCLCGLFILKNKKDEI